MLLFLPFVPINAGKQVLDLGFKRLQVIPDDIIDIFWINLIIAMYQNMSHLFYHSPRSLWMSILELRGKLISSFTNDFYAFDYSIVLNCVL